MLQDHRYGANASRGVPVYALAFAGTKLYRLVTEAHRCEQLAQSCYSTAWRLGLEPGTIQSLVRCPSDYIIEPLYNRSIYQTKCKTHGK